MNKKIAPGKYERAWTNYFLFGKTGCDGTRHIQLQMLVARSGKEPGDLCPAGWVFCGAFGGYNSEEAWNNYFKTVGQYKLMFRGPAPAEPVPSLLASS